jgi:riboflavin kinase / FMN adenylyltransferase
MRVYHDLSSIGADAVGSVVAIGNFDGVHLGHQKVFATTSELAVSINAFPAVLTFSPHPRQFFNPHLPPFALSSMDLKLSRIEHSGIDCAFVQRFDREFAIRRAEEFIENVLVRQLKVRHVVIGDGYRFGNKRSGDVDLLRRMGKRHAFGVTAVAPVRDGGGNVCSSTRIRSALAEGRMSEASSLLGRPWELQAGATGVRDGRIRLPLGNYQRPRCGTYRVAASIVTSSNGEAHSNSSEVETHASINLGDNVVEDALLLDLGNRNLRGQEVGVRILEFVG